MAQGGNITAEMVTVRMNRADIKTPWGFRVSIPGLITGVEDGSLAERAGIQNGDVIEEIQGERVKDIERIKNLVNIPVNEIELVLYRNMMSTRLWRPTITDNSNYVESNAKQTIIPNPKVLVNLEHRSMNQDPLINGFNCSAKPFSATAQSKPLSGGVDASNYQMSKSLHNTFNTDKAEQYYHESGGLFGSDPNAKYGFGHKKEQPAYLNSETLKMIQEDDQNKETLKSVVFARDKSATPNRTSIPTQSRGPLNPNLPICFHCGRNILGLVCRASEVNLHADCFSCSTCGSSLKNVGHQFINTKFYCDIHARQVRGISQPNTKGRMTPDLMNKPSPTNMYNKSLDTVHASYHPDIMGRHPMAQTNNLGSGKRLESNYSSKSVTKSNEERKVISPYGNNGPECVVSKTKSPLPHDIRQATSKAFSKSEGLPNWPPSESSLNCPNKYWSIHLAPTPPKESKSLLDLVNESDCESRGNSRVNSNYPSPYPSPRICTQISPIPKAMQAKNNISNETPSPSVTPRLTKLAGTKEESSKNNDVGANYLSKLPEITTTLVKNDSCLLDVPKSEKQIRWVETPEIIEETDIITEESLSDYRPNGEDDRYDDIEADESDCLDEQEKWIREELEQYRQEKEMEKEIEKETIRQLSEEYDLNLEKDDINIETKSEYVLESITKHQLNLKSQQHKLATLMANAMNLLKNIENSPAFDNTVGNKINSTNQPHFQPHLQTNSRVIWAEQSLNAIEQINEQFEEKINYLNSMDVAKSTFEHQPNISSFCEYESLKNEVPHKTELELLQDDSPQVRLSQLLNEITDQTQYLPRHNFGVNDDNMAANYNQQSQARNLNNTTFDSHDYGKQQHLVNKVTKTTTTTTNSYPSGNQSNNAYENRVPYCGQCKSEIRGAFVMTGGLTYCPEHFICANASCSRKLVDVGFVEEKGKRFCEGCFEKLIAPVCNKCAKPVTGDCLNALQKQWHPTCFACAHCLKPFGNTAFYMENGKPYCEVDWNNLFTTKCVSCKFPIEAGDRWVEALGASFHSNCFSCMACHVNLEGQSFYAKNGQPYCKLHA